MRFKKIFLIFRLDDLTGELEDQKKKVEELYPLL